MGALSMGCVDIKGVHKDVSKQAHAAELGVHTV